jgi:hypothetical protein
VSYLLTLATACVGLPALTEEEFFSRYCDGEVLTLTASFGWPFFY